MEDTSTLWVTVADITAREGIEHAVLGGMLSNYAHNVRMIVDEVLYNIDWIVVCFHCSLDAVKQVDVSGNQ